MLHAKLATFDMTLTFRFFPLLLCLWLGINAHAQKPVYRCETAGKVSYSDEPCMGAKEIDTTPTQGVNMMTGKSRKGADVQRDEHNTAMADALKPLTGMTTDQYRVHKHRLKLSPQDRMECLRLDAKLPELKQRATAALSSEIGAAEVELYKARKRFNDFNC